MSVVIIEPGGMKFPAKLGYSWSNRSRDMRLPHFVTNDDGGDDDDAGHHIYIYLSTLLARNHVTSGTAILLRLTQ